MYLKLVGLEENWIGKEYIYIIRSSLCMYKLQQQLCYLNLNLHLHKQC